MYLRHVMMPKIPPPQSALCWYGRRCAVVNHMGTTVHPLVMGKLLQFPRQIGMLVNFHVMETIFRRVAEEEVLLEMNALVDPSISWTARLTLQLYLVIGRMTTHSWYGGGVRWRLITLMRGYLQRPYRRFQTETTLCHCDPEVALHSQCHRVETMFHYDLPV